jgi:hypothetical protein
MTDGGGEARGNISMGKYKSCVPPDRPHTPPFWGPATWAGGGEGVGELEGKGVKGSGGGGGRKSG